ncbi:uncharacterized protein OCT59_017760 [Rhizophagus irregularis]|uniref:Cdc15p n=4 Tax=Rhizophagus irregularis TaxID=588596 RepID=A0A015JDJ6_RHIIW|nr:kinase-like domain-containing protein [Rhizophagus irregularis DAOM 181602=DAOM 197198]EXX53024.1 Cdc15p [Rhizophagus irregularis DAOM 197198w]POG65765.1 kinase-like domain-containing protein [Rhizophagus irregularis DAOM 181602=DAOM 197198]UZO25495.1 hypothetical protein OCT59_017760 [Rhizophagus irregularis]|eukprot:XP_025172631.1 kinase-like domain-containing protein [Rhizophagus irregularis DAOM 181602=DAOM 197198]
MHKLKSLFNKLNVSNKDSNSINATIAKTDVITENHQSSNKQELNEASLNKNCSYCNKPFTEELWCKECDHRRKIEGWTSGNNDVDKFIKDTIYDARNTYKESLKWVPFGRFKDVKQIGVGGFAKVYSATWIDHGIKVALKRLNGSKNMSAVYLNELKIHWNFYKEDSMFSLIFYGMTKDPETEEFMMILQFADEGNLRSVLSHNFKNILWKDKIIYLYWLIYGLKNLHDLGYFHKDFHSGNILQEGGYQTYISDFGLSGPSNKQKSDDKICGVLPYIAPEVLNGEPYTLSSDIYSFGVIMTELSSGIPPFHKRKHDATLALEICNGLRPNFGKGTPEIYKKLAYKCMNANSNQRPTASELHDIIKFWYCSSRHDKEYQEEEKFGYKGKEIEAMFEEADKEIPNISTSYEKNPDAIYTSRLFTFNNLTKPINSSLITSYLDDEENNKDCQDSQLFDLEVSSSLQLKDDANNKDDSTIE